MLKFSKIVHNRKKITDAILKSVNVNQYLKK